MLNDNKHKKMVIQIAGFALIGILIFIAILRVERSKDYRRSSEYNIILISIDTLRADRLGCYGYKRPTSPTIDALASRGMRFANVIAESSWTLPSHMTMFTGLFPSSHGAVAPRKSINKRIITLTQILKKEGFRTYANTEGGYVNGARGFERGFEIYDDKHKPFIKTIHQAQQWIEQTKSDERYFVFLHTYSVHCPYKSPPRYTEMFHINDTEEHDDLKGKCGNNYYNRMILNAEQVAFISNEYDAGIRYADDRLKGFVDFLEKRNDLEKTILILISDHGEEFQEHGQIGHERTLYRECLHVPLIFVAPNLKPGIVQQTVGLVDLMPTILDMTAIALPDLQGRSLLPLMQGSFDSRQNKPRFSELDRHIRMRSVVDGPMHFIFNDRKQSRELYDMASDPREQHNLLDTQPGHAAKYQQLLQTHQKKTNKRFKAATIELDSEQLQQLRALGYMN